VRKSLGWIALGALLGNAGCGGRSISTTGNNTIANSGANVQAITAGNSGNPAGIVNGAFATVTLCAPGTTNCASIGGLLIDTGSTGVRVLSSVLPAGLNLPRQADAGGNPVGECAQFADGFTWGPVATADVKIAGEQASSLFVQIIADPGFPAPPADCVNNAMGPNENTVSALGANGVLGIGNFLQDCGPACTAAASNPNFYFSCPASGCTAKTQALNQQLQHPVSMFATDNNGLVLELPAVSTSGAISNNGSLVFGIGTQSNNKLGNATVLTLDGNGDFTTSFKGTAFTGFVDSGSNGLFFLDSATTGVPMCTVNTDFYCPAATQTFSATNTGANNGSTIVNFSIANADSLLNNSNPNFLFSDLGAPNPSTFDFGLPFFFGRNVFIAIEGKSTPGGTGPYTAY
jgi:hypothetical protein